MTRVCCRCSTPFDGAPARKYCGDSCAKAAKAVRDAATKATACGRCGRQKRTRNPICLQCKAAARRTMVPCLRCGRDFWPWVGGKHARKYCCRAVATPKPVTERPGKASAKEQAERRRQTARAWYEQNRARKIATASAYRRRARVEVEGYRDRERAHGKAWECRHPEKAKAHRRATRMKRRARLRASYVEHVDAEVVFQRDGGVCGICRQPVDHASNWHVDHVIPLSKGGAHAYANVQLAHGRCNERKGDQMPTVSPTPLGPLMGAGLCG